MQTSRPHCTELADRGVVAVAGTDAEKLLQGLVTNDLDGLRPGSALFTGLLSPQGKILFEFFVVPHQGTLLLETARDRAADLVRRLTMYKLRADVRITDESDRWRVLARWGGEPGTSIENSDGGAGIAFVDPRLAALGDRVLLPAGEAPGTDATEADYHAHRIAVGVPEGSRDYPLGDTFPHEALYDQLRAVSFTKGCYIGQEVVSRMQHRGNLRKRVLPVEGVSPLSSGTPVAAGEIAIGTLGSVSGRRGLALLRLDRAREFAEKGVGLSAGGVPVTIVMPPFVKLSQSETERTP